MTAPLRAPLRLPAALLLVATAATHVPLVPEHLEEAPYIGVLFILLSAASLLLAGLLVRWDTPLVWGVTGLTTLAAVVAFLLSRTVGLPGIGDEVGNWTEPLGLPALAVETLALLACGVVLRSGATPARHVHALPRGTS